MRKGRWLAGFMSAGVIAVVACGGSSNDNSTTAPVDAGPDTNVADTAPDVQPDTNQVDACTVDADTSNVPDAAIGDAGGSTGLCLACGKSKCGAAETACLNDCSCAGTIACIYQNCVKDLGDSLALGQCALAHSCLSGFSLPPALTGLFTCLAGSCTNECNLVVPVSDAGPDAPSDAPADAPSDAPHDAPSDGG